MLSSSEEIKQKRQASKPSMRDFIKRFRKTKTSIPDAIADERALSPTLSSSRQLRRSRAESVSSSEPTDASWEHPRTESVGSGYREKMFQHRTNDSKMRFTTGVTSPNSTPMMSKRRGLQLARDDNDIAMLRRRRQSCPHEDDRDNKNCPIPVVSQSCCNLATTSGVGTPRDRSKSFGQGSLRSLVSRLGRSLTNLAGGGKKKVKKSSSKNPVEVSEPPEPKTFAATEDTKSRKRTKFSSRFKFMKQSSKSTKMKPFKSKMKDKRSKTSNGILDDSSPHCAQEQGENNKQNSKSCVAASTSDPYCASSSDNASSTASPGRSPGDVWLNAADSHAATVRRWSASIESLQAVILSFSRDINKSNATFESDDADDDLDTSDDDDDDLLLSSLGLIADRAQRHRRSKRMTRNQTYAVNVLRPDVRSSYDSDSTFTGDDDDDGFSTCSSSCAECGADLVSRNLPHLDLPDPFDLPDRLSVPHPLYDADQFDIKDQLMIPRRIRTSDETSDLTCVSPLPHLHRNRTSPLPYLDGHPTSPLPHLCEHQSSLLSRLFRMEIPASGTIKPSPSIPAEAPANYDVIVDDEINPATRNNFFPLASSKRFANTHDVIQQDIRTPDVIPAPDVDPTYDVNRVLLDVMQRRKADKISKRKSSTHRQSKRAMAATVINDVVTKSTRIMTSSSSSSSDYDRNPSFGDLERDFEDFVAKCTLRSRRRSTDEVKGQRQITI